MKLKAIIFDWDGVLNDSAHALFKGYLVVLKKFRLPRITFSQFRELWNSNYREFEASIGITPEKRKLSDMIWFEAYTKLRKEVKLFPRAKEFLLKLKKKHKIGLVTVGSRKRVSREIERYKLQGFFDAIITADEVRKLKPDPEALILCAKKLRVKLKDCVYIGDSRGDIIAAKRADMISIAVTWGYHDVLLLKKAKPTYIVNDFDELYKTILSL